MDIHSFLDIKETKDSIVDKLEYLKNQGLEKYIEFALGIFDIKKLPSKKDDNIIEQILPKSPNDLKKKKQNKEYYKAHLACIKKTMKEIFLHDGFINNIKNYSPEADKDMVIYNYHKLLRELLFDMILLLQDYEIEIKKTKSGNFNLGKNLFQSDFTLYQLLPQVIFGQVSYHSFIDKEPFVSIGIIRQVVEFKIRRSFGLHGIYDKSKDSFEPLGMNIIFEELKKYETQIEFALPLSNIIRIYGWSNIYMHSGKKDYLWTIIFVYRYLHELIKGLKDTYNIKTGIKTNQAVIDQIQNNLEMVIKNKNSNLELIKGEPEAMIIK